MADMILALVPFVLDFLDLDVEELIKSGFLSDETFDEATLAVVMHHAKERPKRTPAPVVEWVSTATNEPPPPKKAKRKEPLPDKFLVIAPRARNEPSDEEFRLTYRMTRSLFEDLLVMLGALTDMQMKRKYVGGKHEIPVDLALLMCLEYLGSRKTVKDLAVKYDVSTSSSIGCFKRCLPGLYQLVKHLIKWPDKNTIISTMSEFSQTYGLPGLIGVIDVAHIRVKASQVHHDYYMNQSGVLSVVLQSVCNHKHQFLHCCTGWPGSVDDFSVLNDSDLYQDVQKNQEDFFPSGSFVVGDSSYPLYDWLLTPISDGEELDAAQQTYNYTHSLARRLSGRSFRHLRSRFPRLKYVDLHDMEEIVKVILVCCALHNFCHAKGDTEMFLTDDDEQEELSSPASCHAIVEGILKRQTIVELMQQAI